MVKRQEGLKREAGSRNIRVESHQINAYVPNNVKGGKKFAWGRTTAKGRAREGGTSAYENALFWNRRGKQEVTPIIEAALETR